MTRYLLLILAIISTSACQPKYSEINSIDKFLASPFLYFYPQSPVTVNTLPSHYYANTAPKATVLGDYNSSKSFSTLMAVDFPHILEKNLPPQILEELRKRNLLDKHAVDIFLVTQPLSSLGANKDALNNNLTYLKAHGWADPDAPIEAMGAGTKSRVKRDFLYGLFDSDVDLSYEVKNNLMKPFEVHTHDGQYSPQTAALKLPDAKPKTLSLWSLVIDNNSTTSKPRAIATLHWLISEEDLDSFNQESFKDKIITDFRGETYLKNKASKFDTVGEYFRALKHGPFKTSSIIKKLEDLLGINLS